MTIHDKPAAPRVTCVPLPASTKILKPGRLHPGIRVPMREIALHPTAGEAPVPVYDTSGPYTDPAAVISIDAGLARLREDWIATRGDVEDYEGRAILPADNGLVGPGQAVPSFPVRHRPGGES